MQKQDINPICTDCKRYGNRCKGTANPVWTGCIYKEEKK